MIEDLDTTWINEIEKKHSQLELLELVDIETIKIDILYTSANNNIECIKTIDYCLNKPNFVSKEEIISIIKDNNTYKDNSYILGSILHYNVTINNDNVESFVNSEHEHISSFNKFSSSSMINDIILEPSIHILYDINSIVIFMKSSSKHLGNSNNTTRRVFYKPSSNKKHTRKRT